MSDDRPMMDACPACRFYVNLGPSIRAVFTEVSGLQLKTNVHSYAQGGDNGRTLSFPGAYSFGPVTLKHGMTFDSELFWWCVATASGKIVRVPVTIIMFDVGGKIFGHWELHNAFPSRWSGPELKADSGAVAIETLELAHDGLLVLK